VKALSVYAPAVDEIAPGLWHWRSSHPRIGIDVSSYYLEPERVVLDPMLPPEGVEWIAEHGPPEHLVLTNRHHDRQAWELRDEFGSTVHCISNGVHELEGRGPVEPFDFGDELPGGLVVYEVGAICPDEAALHIPAYDALACADGVIRAHDGSGLAFVPDSLMDAPEETKDRLRDAYRRLLDLDFDLLLLAHGDPVVGGAKEQLRAFVES
jgi:hypothetical protein